jgi:hypothetical protein
MNDKYAVTLRLDAKLYKEWRTHVVRNYGLKVTGKNSDICDLNTGILTSAIKALMGPGETQ